MSEMVDEVAKAIANAANSDPAFRPSVLDWEKIARAAIGAMRKPTEAMREAVLNEMDLPEEVWQTMIDAALADEAGGAYERDG